MRRSLETTHATNTETNSGGGWRGCREIKVCRFVLFSCSVHLRGSHDVLTGTPGPNETVQLDKEFLINRSVMMKGSASVHAQ